MSSIIISIVIFMVFLIISSFFAVIIYLSLKDDKKDYQFTKEEYDKSVPMFVLESGTRHTVFDEKNYKGQVVDTVNVRINDNFDESKNFNIEGIKSIEFARSLTSFALWNIVKKWAQTNAGYVFSDDPKPYNGILNSTLSIPVANVTWKEVIVWCNALTEYMNSLSSSLLKVPCVYCEDPGYCKPITSVFHRCNELDAGSINNPYIISEKDGNTSMDLCIGKGFRLPTIDEWFKLGRSQTLTDRKGRPLTDRFKLFPGKEERITSSGLISYPTGILYEIDTNMKGFVLPVKDCELFLYQDSYIWEWCDDKTNDRVTKRYLRSGDEMNEIYFLQVGVNFFDSIDARSNNFSFRFVRNL